MADGTDTTDDDLPRDGIHFCKRARQRLPLHERRIDIFRFDAATRQTRKVGTTDTANIEEAALALKRFGVANLEAQLAQRKHSGKPQPKDLLLFEVFTAFLLAKEIHWTRQHEMELKNAREAMGLMATNVSGAVIDSVIKRIGNRTPQERLKNFHGAIEDARRVWPDNPLVSTLDSDEQTRFVEASREFGRADSTITSRLTLVWTMLYWAKKKRMQLDVPDKIGAEDWLPSKNGKRAKKKYTLRDLAAMLNYAGDTNDEAAWRFLNLQIPLGCRTRTAAGMIYPQIDCEDHRVHTNPPGRRETRKRRPTLPLAPTLEAEVLKWKTSATNVHPLYIVTECGRLVDHDTIWGRIQAATGVGGRPMDIRRFTRTWLYEFPGVLPKQADIYIGHDDIETSDTSKRFYIMSSDSFLDTVVLGIEGIYDALQPLVYYPLGRRLASAKPEQSTWLRSIPKLRDKRANCVTSLISKCLDTQEIATPEETLR